MKGEQLARALGVFSIGLGLAELVAPARTGRYLGMHRTGLIRACGGREIAAGASILAQPRQARWLWSRVGGDMLDLGALVWTLTKRNSKRRNVGLALGAVAAVTAIDVLCARQLES
ncbi:MAG TPA: hypothetical protein VFH57_02015 [Gammaproteobacteria bacterium]|jgi:hypothetical protein|nr:hypothetical protein [Gammaproteobacteria bacterium]